MEKQCVAEVMNKSFGSEVVKPENIGEVPNDGCEGHMGSGPWQVYAARAGEFTILLYYYETTGEMRVVEV